MRTLARAVFFLAALPAIVRAALRVSWLQRRLPLDELAARLRAAPRFALPLLRDKPEWLLASLDRLLPLLPPRGYGRCLKRSLLLLDLWSRCGLRPRLHLAAPVERTTGHRESHAWVTVEPRLDVAPSAIALGTSAEGYPEAFVL
ncbi:MAG TPA: lasso peptide biosynthesis protein [Thermoanaerobaculia bacterium]|jgi:hypothetical protein|nr:lasso peptide biosynthesis protein [Thermoanaerobaculia bacterium]